MKPVRLCIYSILIVIASLASCRQDPDPGPEPRYEEYFPLQPGAWRIYQVDSIGRPTPVNDNDTLNYQLREVVDSPFTDGAGNTMYKVMRFRRATANDAWSLHEIFAAGIAGNEAIQQEGNFRYVKLSFPVREGRSWDADVYNNEDPDGFLRSRYAEVHKPATIDDNSFDSTTLVELNNAEDAISSDYKIERYAAGIGLVEFQHDSVTTQYQSFWIRKRIVSFGR